jgi:hypothetical protein
MSTEPWPNFFFELDEEQTEYLRNLSAHCQEVANYGSKAFQRIMNTRPLGEEKDFPPLILLLRHSLEIIDSIAALIANGNVEPCKILLRSLLEALLNIKWMTYERFEERSKAFVIHRAHEELKRIEKYDASSPGGKLFYAELRANANFSPDFDSLPFKEFRARKIRLIKSDYYSAAEIEYQQLWKASRNNRPPKYWYSMFPGVSSAVPNDLRALARQVKLLDLYDFLYKFWSDSTHSTDVIAGKISHPNGIIPIRSLENVHTVAFYTIVLGYRCIRTASNAYNTKLVSEIDHWYDVDMREARSWIGKNARKAYVL